jgi:hypothetical protein
MNKQGVPNRSSGRVNVICMENVCPFRGERARAVREEQGAQMQLTSSKGPERIEIPTMNKGQPFQERVFLSSFIPFFLLAKKRTCSRLFVCAK